MREIKDEMVKNYLDDLSIISHDFFLIVSQVREIFFEICPVLMEGIKYGGVVFYLNKKLIAGIWTYKNHISIEISRGAELVDNNKVLEGNGRFRRHIKLLSMNDIVKKEVKKIIIATCCLNSDS